MNTKKEYDEDREYTQRSRVAVFEEEMKRLKRLMYGEEAHIWTYMTDSQGKYSEKAASAFVEQLVDVARCQKMHFGNDESADKRSFYGNLLYCVLRVYASGYTLCANGSRICLGEPEDILFSDIISAFDTDPEAFLDGKLVFFMEHFYEIFAHKTICLDALRTQTDMTERLQEEIPWADWPVYDALEEAHAQDLGYDIEEIREQNRQLLAEMEQQACEEKERLLRTFDAQERFCRSLEEISCYLERSPVLSGQMLTELRQLILDFLAAEGHAVFSNEDAYIAVMVQLKKTIRTARKYVED